MQRQTIEMEHIEREQIATKMKISYATTEVRVTQLEQNLNK